MLGYKNSHSNFCQNLTGENRYVPGRLTAGGDIRGSDPFTGNTRYQPAASVVNSVVPTVGADPFTGKTINYTLFILFGWTFL